ncbi:hypothetical protein H6503_06950 [Candidatus Woesearchaeota archaeon]|nr:hypothetical protein [Candidatus Woesearchaeota archaeon]
MKDIDSIVDSFEHKHLGKKHSKVGDATEKLSDRVMDAFSRMKSKFVIGTAIVAASAALIGGYLWVEYALGRQDYPIRNVVFKAQEEVKISGGSEDKGSDEIDKEVEIEFREGGVAGDVESKIGTYHLLTKRSISADLERYDVHDSQYQRIASASKRPERVQSGGSLRAKLVFNEELAEVTKPGESKSDKHYSNYQFIPERGWKEREVTVMDENGDRVLKKMLTEHRTPILGFFYGLNFREGTTLEEFLPSDHAKEFFETVKALDSDKVMSKGGRERLVEKAIDIAEALPKITIYRSYEDGIIDWFPQESTIYLGRKANWFQRFANSWGFGDRTMRFRVENHWDLWPGNIPGLENFEIGAGDDSIKPFAKANNGGYSIHDKFGEVARIEIKDFFFHYGQDLVHFYYLDLNGDGKIDKETEMIGKVLYGISHDQHIDLDELVGEGRQKQFLTFSADYVFMSPTSDKERGTELMDLCGYIETFLADAINRGFGKHSSLGYINRVRSDYMFFKDPEIENMSRPLTEESTLVAKHDIVELLKSAGRPQAIEIAEHYGVNDLVEGYEPSSDLHVKFPIKPYAILLLGGGAVAGLTYLRRRNRSEENDARRD